MNLTGRIAPTPLQLGRLAIILIGAIALLWVVWASTFATLRRASNPEAALSWWPDAETETLAAFTIVQADQRPETVRRARALAESALRREPVNAAAARTLAVIADIERRPEQSERLFNYSERLSRRDILAQIWFIESRVRRNDIAGALRHYDRALRASRDIRTLLIPILVTATSDRAVVGPLAGLVAGRPPWWRGFADRLVNEGRSPEGLFRITHALRLDPIVEEERLLLSRAISRLVAAGAYQPAASLYRQSHRGSAGPLIRNGDFEVLEPGLPPFDWQLLDEPDLGAILQPLNGDPTSSVLTLVASNGRSGEVARQLLLLRPGRYRLSARSGGQGTELSRPSLSLTCAGQNGRALARLDLPLGGGSGTSSGMPVVVPAGACAAQWLVITAREPETGEGSAWVDSIAVAPVR